MRSSPALQRRLAHIDQVADRTELMDMWPELFSQPLPKSMSLPLMKRAIAYRLQANALGGLKPATQRYLQEVVGSSATLPSPPSTGVAAGTRLVRQWHGKIYEAVVEADGVVVNGERYTSLTDAARAITGVRWSGPRFFGLVKVKSK